MRALPWVVTIAVLSSAETANATDHDELDEWQTSEAADTAEPPRRTGGWILEAATGGAVAVSICEGKGEECQGPSLGQVILSQHVGYHVNGDGTGFAIGIGVQEAFVTFLRVQPGLRLWGDIGIDDDGLVFMTPHAQIGYARYQLDDGFNLFNWQAGLSLRFVLSEHVSMTLTPATFDWATEGDRLYSWLDAGVGLGIMF